MPMIRSSRAGSVPGPTRTRSSSCPTGRSTISRRVSAGRSTGWCRTSWPPAPWRSAPSAPMTRAWITASRCCAGLSRRCAVGAEIAAPPTPRMGAAVPAKAVGTLTRRASLNAAASLVDYFAKAGVGLIVTPILVSGLGRSLFGISAMLSQLTGYMSPADGRPNEALRLIIAQRQSSPDDAAKRRSVGAALAVWAIMLPLILVLGAVISFWVAPALTKVSPELRGPVQLTTALLAMTFLMAGLGDVPESVLSGMNLGYRRMGLQAGLNALGGALAVASIWLGLGLVGLGGAQIIRAAVTGLFFWVVARAFVHWYGVERPTWAEVKSLFSMSIWLSAGEAIAKVLLASDLLVLGSVVAPAVVTTYVLTGYAARMVTGIHLFTTGAAMPGIGGLIG